MKNDAWTVGVVAGLLAAGVMMAEVVALDQVAIQVDATRAIGELEPFWASQIVHPTERLLTDEGAELLRLMTEAGAARQFVRIYNQPEEAIRVAEDGSISYDWGRFDEMANMILATGNKLKVVFFGMPRELAAHPQAEKVRPSGARICFSPPMDYRQWEALCGDFIRHVIVKFGLEEVREWTFRCWNEPNLPTFWHRGDMDAYLKLYDFFAKGVKEVHPEIKIGGPGLSSTATYQDPKFYRMFLEHVATGRNHATGEGGSPIDFISVHTYGGSGAAGGPGRDFPDVSYMMEQQSRYADMRDEYPQLKNLPIHVEEWGVTASGNIGVAQKPTAAVRNSEYGAAFLANWVAEHIRMRQENDRLLQSFTFCASGYEASRPRDFMGFRTLETRSGIHKPILNGFKLLNRLAPELVETASTPVVSPVSAFATRDQERITVLVSHYRHDRIHGDGDPMEVTLKAIPHWLPERRVTLQHWRIDLDHSNAHTVFRNMGSPKDPTPEQIETLRRGMCLELLEPARDFDNASQLSLRFELPPNAVSLLEFTVN